MENDYRVMNIVSLEMDRVDDAEESAESTLSNSSGLTVHNSRGDSDSKLDGWTNEKHNSYLDYLESSFVTQLYSLLGGETQRLSRARDVQSNSHKSTHQFTVLQNGCWQKVNFGKKRACSGKDSSQSNSASPNGDALCSEETKHSGDKACTRTSMRNSYPAQSSAEASGQNFREEELEKGCDSEVTRKRKRGANYDDSSLKDDQVVP